VLVCNGTTKNQGQGKKSRSKAKQKRGIPENLKRRKKILFLPEKIERMGWPEK